MMRFPYTVGMHSAVAHEVARKRLDRLMAMSPDERVQLAMRLGEEGVRSYMSIHGVDRRTAIARIKATHRQGRRVSSCDDAS